MAETQLSSSAVHIVDTKFKIGKTMRRPNFLFGYKVAIVIRGIDSSISIWL